jgi:hypothetical protein
MFDSVKLGLSEALDSAIIWWENLGSFEKKKLLDRHNIVKIGPSSCIFTCFMDGGRPISRIAISSSVLLTLYKNRLDPKEDITDIWHYEYQNSQK